MQLSQFKPNTTCFFPSPAAKAKDDQFGRLNAQTDGTDGKNQCRHRQDSNLRGRTQEISNLSP
jgi:hypothetical protein